MICPNCGTRVMEEKTIMGKKEERVLKYIAEEKKKDVAERKANRKPGGRPKKRVDDRDFTQLVKQCIEETSTKKEAVELFRNKANLKSWNTAHCYFYKFKEKRKS